MLQSVSNNDCKRIEELLDTLYRRDDKLVKVFCQVLLEDDQESIVTIVLGLPLKLISESTEVSSTGDSIDSPSRKRNAAADLAHGGLNCASIVLLDVWGWFLSF